MMPIDPSDVVSRLPWWITLDQDEIEALRRRLLAFIESAFRPSLRRETEDVVQHAFTMLYRHREHVEPDNDGLFRYLYTVARNYALDRVRATRLRSGNIETAAHLFAARRPAQPSPETVEQIRRVREFFCELDDLDRLIVWSHVVDGRSVRAIATDLEMRWHDVARIVERSLHRLRLWLDRPASREAS